MEKIKRIHAQIYNILIYLGFICLVMTMPVKTMLLNFLIAPMSIAEMIDTGKLTEMLAKMSIVDAVLFYLLLSSAICFIVSYIMRCTLLKCKYCGKNGFSSQGIRNKNVYCKNCGEIFEWENK